MRRCLGGSWAPPTPWEGPGGVPNLRGGERVCPSNLSGGPRATLRCPHPLPEGPGWLRVTPTLTLPGGPHPSLGGAPSLLGVPHPSLNVLGHWGPPRGHQRASGGVRDSLGDIRDLPRTLWRLWGTPIPPGGCPQPSLSVPPPIPGGPHPSLGVPPNPGGPHPSLVSPHPSWGGVCPPPSLGVPPTPQGSWASQPLPE